MSSHHRGVAYLYRWLPRQMRHKKVECDVFTVHKLIYYPSNLGLHMIRIGEQKVFVDKRRTRQNHRKFTTVIRVVVPAPETFGMTPMLTYLITTPFT